MIKVFIDGKEGTTGLQIYDRINSFKDIELITLPEDLRKDALARKEAINSSDITFLCLPDAAAVESVSLIEKENVRIIDASTAHRISAGWAYGLPELSLQHFENIKNGTYPITGPLYAVTWKGNNNENVEKLLEWVLSEEGQYIIEKTGYVGIN